jgi:hemolysin activation/secretion protein
MKSYKLFLYARGCIVLAVMLLCPFTAYAGFLDMPEITEVPELERKSMLKDLDIPSVRERDPDPEAGPRLNVMKFKLQGIVEYPELGITRKDIATLIEGIRYDLMEEYKLLDSGFTENELADVSKKLVEIEEETMDRHVTEMDLQQLIWLVRDQRSKRGITLGKIETVADRITRFYRERGFILAKAYIPEQKVRDGVVTLTLLLGTLGEVELKNSQLYDRQTLTSVFDPMMGKPVTSSAVEEDLYLLNDYPGVSAVGFFEPGEQVGDTRLELNVIDEQQYQGLLKIDNHGTDLTGKYRVYVEGNANNLAGISDQLTLGVLNSFSPDNSFYGQLKYAASLFSPRFFFSVGYSTNQFVLGKGNNDAVNALELAGDTSTIDLSLLYKIKRSRVSSHSIQLVRSNIVSSLSSDAPGVNLQGILDNGVDSTELNYSFDVLDEKGKKLHQGNISVLGGHLKSELAVNKKQDFSVLSGDYTFLTFFKVPFTDVVSRILLRSSWQFSGESLSSINQFSLAGPTTVKAYSVNTFSADSAVYAGVEWIFDKPKWLDYDVAGKSLSQVIQPYIFLDAAYGVQKSILEGEDDINATLSDVGLGFRFNFTKNASGNLQLALPAEKSFSSDSFSVEETGVQAIFDFQYAF